MVWITLVAKLNIRQFTFYTNSSNLMSAKFSYYIAIQYEISMYTNLCMQCYIVANRIANVVTLETFMDFCIREEYPDVHTEHL